MALIIKRCRPILLELGKYFLYLTVQKLKDCFLDPYDTKLAVFVCVLFLVAILKLLEVVFKNGLNNVPASGFIDWYMDVHTMFKQERQEEISFNKKLVEYPQGVRVGVAPSEAWERRMKCKYLKPFIVTLRVINPAW